MSPFKKTLLGILCGGLLTCSPGLDAYAIGTGGPAVSKSTGARGLLQITGEIVCVDCNLTEAQRQYPDLLDLYLLENEQGELVIRVQSVNNSMNRGRGEEVSGQWSDIAWPPRIWVRAPEEVFDRLLRKSSVQREVEISGILHSTRTLDVAEVRFTG